MTIKIDDLAKIAASASDRGRLVLFLGSGFSCYYGYPSWKGFADKLIKGLFSKNKFLVSDELQKSMSDFLDSKDYDSKQLISFVKMQAGSDAEYSNLFKDCLSSNCKEDEPKAQELIKSFKCSVVTTNADCLLDGAFSENDGEKVLYETEDIIRKFEIKDFERNLWHIHGSVKSIKSLVFTQEEYADRYNSQDYCKALDRFFSDYRPVIIFVGYGLAEDQVLQHILRNAKTGENNRYAIYPKKSKNQFEDYLTEEIYRSEYNIQPLSYTRSTESGQNEYHGMYDSLNAIALAIHERNSGTTDVSKLFLAIEKNSSPSVIKRYYNAVKESGNVNLSDIQITCLLKANHYLSKENDGVAEIYSDLLNNIEFSKNDLISADALLSYCLKFNKKINNEYFYEVLNHSSIRSAIRVLLEHGGRHILHSKWYGKYAERTIRYYFHYIHQENECFEIADWFSTRIPNEIETKKNLSAILNICSGKGVPESAMMDFTTFISRPLFKTYLSRCLDSSSEKNVEFFVNKLISKGKKNQISLFFALCTINWFNRPLTGSYKKLLAVIKNSPQLPDNFYCLLFDSLPKLDVWGSDDKANSISQLVHEVISTLKKKGRLNFGFDHIDQYMQAVSDGRTRLPYEEFDTLIKRQSSGNIVNEVYSGISEGGYRGYAAILGFNSKKHKAAKIQGIEANTDFEVALGAMGDFSSAGKHPTLEDQSKTPVLTKPSSKVNLTRRKSTWQKSHVNSHPHMKTSRGIKKAASSRDAGLKTHSLAGRLWSKAKGSIEYVVDFSEQSDSAVEIINKNFRAFALSGKIDEMMDNSEIYHQIDKNGPNVLFSLSNDAIPYVCSRYFDGSISAKSRLAPFLLKLQPPYNRQISSSSYLALFATLSDAVSKAVYQKHSIDVLSEGFCFFLKQGQGWCQTIKNVADDLEGPYGTKFNFVRLIGLGLEFGENVSANANKLLSKLSEDNDFSDSVQRVIFLSVDYYFEKNKNLVRKQLKKKMPKNSLLIANNQNIELLLLLKKHKLLKQFLNNNISAGQKWRWIYFMLECYANGSSKGLTTRDFKGLRELPRAVYEYSKINPDFFVNHQSSKSGGNRILNFIKGECISEQKRYISLINDNLSKK